MFLRNIFHTYPIKIDESQKKWLRRILNSTKVTQRLPMSILSYAFSSLGCVKCGCHSTRWLCSFQHTAIIWEDAQLRKHLYMLASWTIQSILAISSTSRYDLEYLRHYTDLEVLPFYRYCIYTKITHSYVPSRDKIPIFVRKVIYHNWDNRFTTDIKYVKVIDIEKLYKFYSFSDLVHHRAVVFLAYATMTYKLSELYYSLGILLFVPSMSYYRNINNPRQGTMVWSC